MTGRFFSPGAAAALADAYPEAPATLSHRLSGHPLFELASLVDLANRMRPQDVLCCRGDVPIGSEGDGAPPNSLTAEATIRSIERCGSWMVLKKVEQDPTCRALTDALLDELEPAVRAATGTTRQREAFIFISSPGAVTPFHFDGEHNVLLQLAGEKIFTVFPPGDPRFAPPEAHEAFHLSGRYTLPWRDEFEACGRPVRLAAGDALYVPVKAPHWVRNGDKVSVSLSITWRSGWSEREERAHRFNHWLRRAGWCPRPPGRYPRQNHLKALACRVAGKALRATGVEA